MDVSTPLIGSGGSARVFNAKYKGQAVALKMVWCVEVREVAHCPSLVSVVFYYISPFSLSLCP
jgi:hypothetical protein